MDINSNDEPPHFDINLNILDKSHLERGISNKILCCFNKHSNDRVLIRIYGEKTELIIDRKAEKECMKLMSRHGFAAPIYCTFENGIAYGFVPGVVLDVNNVKDKKIATLVAKRMAEVHSIKFPDLQTRPCLFEQIERFLDAVPNKFENPEDQTKYESKFLPLNELKSEYERLKCRVQELNCSLVFCHNDLLLRNIIYDSEKECVTFIDFEYGGLNYQAYDIADHFTEYAGTENVDFSLYPDEQYQLWWLKTYLEFYHKFNNLAPVTENDVRILYVQVNVLSLAAHFLWAVWAVVQAKYSSIDFDTELID